MRKPAIEGGEPVRKTTLPYGRQSIDDADARAVEAALRSGWITQGPAIDAFEAALRKVTQAPHAHAISNGTAALHAAYFAAGVGPGDEVVTTPMTFAATSNAALYLGARPVFADVDERTLNLSPEAVAERITPRTKVIAPVHFAGGPADMKAFHDLARDHGLVLVEDAAHALGAEVLGKPVGATGDMATYSFHPVKHVTTGEGGAVSAHDPQHAARVKRFRSHGITKDAKERGGEEPWFYEMVDLGYNYRITDLQAALGTSQLGRLDAFVERRRQIARAYDAAFKDLETLETPVETPGTRHAYHLYPIRLRLDRLKTGRREVFRALQAEGLGVTVHYIPVHLHPYYRQNLGGAKGQHPVAEGAYERLVSLPVFPAMTDQDVQDVVEAVRKVTTWYAR